MTSDLTEMRGVGPARSDYLAEHGYEDYQDLAEADHTTIAEEIDEITEDTALQIVVQAQNILEEEDAEIEENISTDDEVDEMMDDLIEEDVEEDEDDSLDVIEFELNLENALQHDTFFASVMRHRETMLKSNRSDTDLFDDILNQMRSSTVDEPVELTVEKDGLNELHNAVRKLVVEYQSNNLIDHMNALKEVQRQINEVRDLHLF